MKTSLSKKSKSIISKSAKNIIAKGALKTIDVLFPRRCPVCFDIVQPSGQLICPACAGSLLPIKGPSCKKCGKEVAHERMEYCLDCIRHPRSFEYNLPLFQYNSCASLSMSAIKYKNKREFLDFYIEAAWYRLGSGCIRIRPELVVPVPVHPSRKRTRGFNQAELLARGIAVRLQVPVCSAALIRVKKTAPQKELDPAGRLKNLEQAFAPGRIPSGIKTVLLTDDIYTTGSTLEACTRILKSMGVEKVYTLTLFIGSGA